MNESIPPSDYHQKYYGSKRFRIFNKLRSDKPKLNIILFFATCASTFFTGWIYNGYWQAGVWYGTSIIAILLAHEMGHYLMCKKYGIQATLPYFMPLPGYLFGTLGAFIKMESPVPSRKALFDVAVAGPLAGFALTIPAIYFGLQLSEVVDIKSSLSEGTIYLGESFLFAKLSKLAIGTLPEGKDVMLHPLAYAGWVGLFVTALNLLPIGQLDGGHLVYALLGRRHNIVAMASLVVFGYICIAIYPGWVLLLILLLWFGPRHPPTLDETPLDEKRIAIGILTLMIFVLSFTPEPIKLLSP